MADLATGILKRINKMQFALRVPERSYRPGPREIAIHPDLIRGLSLIEGAVVTGRVEKKKRPSTKRI